MTMTRILLLSLVLPGFLSLPIQAQASAGAPRKRLWRRHDEGSVLSAVAIRADGRQEPDADSAQAPEPAAENGVDAAATGEDKDVAAENDLDATAATGNESNAESEELPHDFTTEGSEASCTTVADCGNCLAGCHDGQCFSSTGDTAECAGKENGHALGSGFWCWEGKRNYMCRAFNSTGSPSPNALSQAQHLTTDPELAKCSTNDDCSGCAHGCYADMGLCLSTQGEDPECRDHENGYPIGFGFVCWDGRRDYMCKATANQDSASSADSGDHEAASDDLPCDGMPTPMDGYCTKVGSNLCTEFSKLELPSMGQGGSFENNFWCKNMCSKYNQQCIAYQVTLEFCTLFEGSNCVGDETADGTQCQICTFR